MNETSELQATARALAAAAGCVYPPDAHIEPICQILSDAMGNLDPALVIAKVAEELGLVLSPVRVELMRTALSPLCGSLESERGVGIIWRKNRAGGRTYFTDESGAICLAWDTALVNRPTILELLQLELLLLEREGVLENRHEVMAEVVVGDRPMGWLRIHVTSSAPPEEVPQIVADSMIFPPRLSGQVEVVYGQN